MKPEVTRMGALSMQVCVPNEWSDPEVIEFAEREYPCGTTHGWNIRRHDSELLNGDAERVRCRDVQRGASGFVHVMLDA